MNEMDPVSVFRALYDSKCIKFGQYDLKSGLVAPHYIDLRRLALYPKLQEAVVSQVVEKFLTPQALGSIMAQLRREQYQRKVSSDSGLKSLEQAPTGMHHHQHLMGANSCSASQNESDADSQLEDEIETCSEEGCEEHPHSSASSFKPIISGVPYGAVPLAATIAYKAQLPYLLECKGTKAHGEQQSLEDEFAGGEQARALPSDHHQDDELSLPLDQPSFNEHQQQSIVLIEDVICSGESTLEAVRSLERLGLKVEFVICIVDREENGCNLLLEQQGIKVFALYNMIAILRVLEATERISTELFTSTRQWITQNQLKNIGVTPAATHLPTTTGRKTQCTLTATKSHADSTKPAGPIEVVSS